MVGGARGRVKARGGNVSRRFARGLAPWIDAMDRPNGSTQWIDQACASRGLGSTDCGYVDTMQAFVFVVAAAFGGITAAQVLPTGFLVETLAPGQTGPTSLDFL